MHKKL